jgi:hypothetical protein
MDRQPTRGRSLVGGSWSRHVELTSRPDHGARTATTAQTGDGPRPRWGGSLHLIVVGRRWVFEWRAQAPSLSELEARRN